jgi:hypothetical protein
MEELNSEVENWADADCQAHEKTKVKTW